MQGDLEKRSPQEVRTEIWRTRHSAEKKLYILLTVLGLIRVAMLAADMFTRHAAFTELERLGLEDYSGTLLIFRLLSLMTGFGSVVILLVSLLVQLYRYYGTQLSYGVRVTERNFPEIHAKVQEYTEILGLRKAPEVYVRQMNGTVNAAAAWVPGRTFIQLNAEIVDLAYMENQDFEPVYFVLAHEMGHIFLHHVQLPYTVWPILSQFVPVLGQLLFQMLQRAREYSADRVAQALTDLTAQLDTMMVLTVGRHAYKHVNAVDYYADIIGRRTALERFARWCINLLSSHPIMPFRVQALLDEQKHSGRLI